MKNSINYWLLILLISILSGFLFYWFQVRPSNIKSMCSNEVSSWIKEKKATSEDTDIIKTKLDLCLYRNGLSR
jgi:hypothetical protein